MKYFKNIFRQKEKLKTKLKELMTQLDIIEKEKENNKLKKSPLEFYDIIINIDSIYNVCKKGWQVLMNEKGKDMIDSKNKEKKLVIGILGNKKKGKSFFLQELLSEDLQTGVDTIGLSIKLSQDNFIILDSSGLDSPILGSKKDIIKNTIDKVYIEEFIKTYIMKYSKILILIIGMLTFSEQKLVNKIIFQCNKLNYKLIIIHNLQELETNNQVENYIINILLNSANFNLKFNDKNEDHKLFDVNNRSIRHYIFAKKNSEAGNYYNEKTIESVREIIKISNNKYNYDYKETLKDHFKNISKELLEINPEIELILNDEENTMIEENENIIYKNLIKHKIILKYEGEINIKLKQFIKDDLGLISFIKNGFIPEYECYYTNKEFVIKIDCTGESNISAKNIQNEGEIPIIEITGERKRNHIKEKDVNYLITRESGKFDFYIPFTNPNATLGSLLKEEVSNGIKTFIFSVVKINNNK